MAYGQPFYNYAGNAYAPMQTSPYGMYQTQSQMQTMGQNTQFNGYQTQGQANTQQPVAMPPKSNVQPVMGLQDAINRTVEPNTNTYYADQDNDIIYLVSMDMQGRKIARTFSVKDITDEVAEQSKQPQEKVDLSSYVTKSDLKDEMKAFEDKFMNYAASFWQNMPNSSQVTTKKKSAPKVEVETDDEE